MLSGQLATGTVTRRDQCLILSRGLLQSEQVLNAGDEFWVIPRLLQIIRSAFL